MLARKAQLGWIVMGLVVISLTIATFFVFASFRNNSDTSSQQLALLASESLYSQQYADEVLHFVVLQAIRETTESDFRAHFENRFITLLQKYSSEEARYGTVWRDVLERRTYTLTELNGVYTLRVPQVQQTTRSPDNRHQITRTFDLEVRFTRDGLL